MFLVLNMKKYILQIFLSFFLFSCGETQPNDLLPERNVNVSVDLSLPMYQDLLVPGGWAYTPTSAEYGFKGILVYNKNGNYVAFDRACPHYAVNDCLAMTFDGLYLKCACDNSTFNILNGGTSAQVNYQAREYHVQANGNILIITSY